MEPEVTTHRVKEGETTIFRQNRPVRFELRLTNGTVIEGIIPANTDFKIDLKQGDVVSFDIFIEDIPSRPHSIEQ
ncbi:MAG: hypothetical protein WCD24_11250 [Serratia inhibens]|uniref:hypothetical protein n=1 Tax=Serratia inhibens TaxID=2338073 RepID=UPI003C79D614